MDGASGGSREPNSGSLVCFNCFKEGHIMRDCTEEDFGRNRRRPMCFGGGGFDGSVAEGGGGFGDADSGSSSSGCRKCGEQGHFAGDCDSTNPPMQEVEDRESAPTHVPVEEAVEASSEERIPRRQARNRDAKRFNLTPREFHFFLNEPHAGFVKDLRLRNNCRVKYSGMSKKDSVKDPHFLIMSVLGQGQTADVHVREVEVGLDQYLVANQLRRTATYVRLPNEFASARNAPVAAVQATPTPTPMPTASRISNTLPMSRIPSNGPWFSRPFERPPSRAPTSMLTSLSPFTDPRSQIQSPAIVDGALPSVDEMMSEYLFSSSSANTRATANLIDFGEGFGDDLPTAQGGESAEEGESSSGGAMAMASSGMDHRQPVSEVETYVMDPLLVSWLAAVNEESQLKFPEGLGEISLSELSMDEWNLFADSLKKSVETISSYHYGLVTTLWKRVRVMDLNLTKLSEKLPRLIKMISDLKRSLPARQAYVDDQERQLEQFRCQLCLKRWKDAVLNCGDTFCRKCVNMFLKKFNHCPLCRHDITSVWGLY